LDLGIVTRVFLLHACEKDAQRGRVQGNMTDRTMTGDGTEKRDWFLNWVTAIMAPPIDRGILVEAHVIQAQIYLSKQGD
jgi:hypothetical protein